MALRLLIGPSRSGKTEQILNEIASQDALKRVFYIVPEQMTLSSQQKLLAHVPGHGVMNTEVLSFSRFAHRIFEEVGNPAREVLDDMCKSLLLFRIASDVADQLKYYGSSIRKSGFIGQMKLMITEMLQYQIDPEAIRNMLDDGVFTPVVAAKWHDILLIWDEYSKEISSERISSEQLLDYLTARLPASETVRQTCFYFDEFSGFTPQQYAVLSELVRLAPKVTVSLSMSEKALAAAKKGYCPGGVFHENARTYAKLHAVAESLTVPCADEVLPDREEASPIKVLRESLFDYSVPALPKDEAQRQEQVFMSVFPTMSAEVSALCGEILHLLRKEHYRLRDIAVIAPSLARYEHMLSRALDTYQLDAYLDIKTPITAHPFSQLILKAVHACTTGLSAQDLMAVLKTGLTPLDDEQLDLFENEILSTGRTDYLTFCGRLEAHVEWEGAPVLSGALKAFCEKQKKKTLTVTERLDAITDFLEKLDIKTRMEQLAAQMEQQAAPSGSRQSSVRMLRRSAEYAQLYECFSGIVASVKKYMGPQPISVKDFSTLLELGLGQYRLSVIPPSVDQLIIGDPASIHLAEAKVLFVIGFDEASFPGEVDNPGLFNRQERALLREKLEMAPDSEENVSLRYLQLYTLLGKTTEKVYFSAFRADSDGKANPQNLLWQRIGLIVGSHEWPARPELPTPRAALLEKGNDLSESAKAWLSQNGYQASVGKLAQAVSARNKTEKLDTKTVRQLVEQYYKVFSVSQIEQYVKCPFSYFSEYLLCLQPRKDGSLVTRLDDGILMHKILELSSHLLTSFVPEEGVSEEEAEKALKDEVLALCESSVSKEEYYIYQGNARYRYYWQRLQANAADAVNMIRKQLAVSGFVPEKFEWSFGDSVPLSISLPNGEKWGFRGKIDRIDVLNEEGTAYIRIVDYKSSGRSFDENSTLEGTTLQLPIYMEAALEQYRPKEKCENSLPAGFFYFDLSAADQKAAKMKGLVLSDRGMIAKMDSQFGEKNDAFGINYALTKEGTPRNKECKAASLGQFKELGDFAKQKIAETAEKILDGEITACPTVYEKKNETGEKEVSCAYCDYRSVCGFDARLGGVVSRQIPDVDDFWDAIHKYTTKQDLP